MALKINLTEEKPADLVFIGQDEAGDDYELRVKFKRRLNRAQSQEIVYTKGKGRKAQTRIDHEKLYRMTIESIGPLDLGDGPKELTTPEVIVRVMVSGELDPEITDAIDEYALKQNRMGDVEKKA